MHGVLEHLPPLRGGRKGGAPPVEDQIEAEDGSTAGVGSIAKVCAVCFRVSNMSESVY
jgi:hypothetical protein